MNLRKVVAGLLISLLCGNLASAQRLNKVSLMFGTANFNELNGGLYFKVAERISAGLETGYWYNVLNGTNWKFYDGESTSILINRKRFNRYGFILRPGVNFFRKESENFLTLQFEFADIKSHKFEFSDGKYSGTFTDRTLIYGLGYKYNFSVSRILVFHVGTGLSLKVYRRNYIRLYQRGKDIPDINPRDVKYLIKPIFNTGVSIFLHKK